MGLNREFDDSQELRVIKDIRRQLVFSNQLKVLELEANLKISGLYDEFKAELVKIKNNVNT